jgi:PHD-zinc-finger like domain
MNRYEKPIKA